MKKLHMTFLNEDGSKKTLVIRCVHQNLSPAVVKEAMQQIVALELFEKNGLRLMTEVHSAKYVETIETVVFDINVAPVPTPASNARQQESCEASEESQRIANQHQDKPEETTDRQIEAVSAPVIQGDPPHLDIAAGLGLLGEYRWQEQQHKQRLQRAYLVAGLTVLQRTLLIRQRSRKKGSLQVQLE